MKFFERFGIRAITTAPNASWQNGRSERHGSFLQQMLTRMDLQESITTRSELERCLGQCTSSKNALHRGYSPEMLVFGKPPRVPGSVLSDHSIPSHTWQEGSDIQTHQFRDMLRCWEQARVAFHQADNDAALRRALLRRPCPHRGNYPQGSSVMIWRTIQGQGARTGPQRVVIHADQHTIWSTVAGKLFRSAPENVRPVSNEEAALVPAETEDIETEMSRLFAWHLQQKCQLTLCLNK